MIEVLLQLPIQDATKNLLEKSYAIDFGIGVLSSMAIVFIAFIWIMYKQTILERRTHDELQERNNKLFVEIIKETNDTLKKLELTIAQHNITIEMLIKKN